VTYTAVVEVDNPRRSFALEMTTHHSANPTVRSGLFEYPTRHFDTDRPRDDREWQAATLAPEPPLGKGEGRVWVPHERRARPGENRTANDCHRRDDGIHTEVMRGSLPLETKSSRTKFDTSDKSKSSKVL